MDYVQVLPTEAFTGKAFYKEEGKYIECVIKRPGVINGRRPITISGKEGGENIQRFFIVLTVRQVISHGLCQMIII